MTFDIADAVARATDAWLAANTVGVPVSLLKGGNVAKLDHTYIDLTITVAGVSREVEAKVEYIHTRGFGAIYDGSGPISPPEPENAEIQHVYVTLQGYAVVGGQTPAMDIANLLTDGQIEAIANEILEQGQQ